MGKSRQTALFGIHIATDMPRFFLCRVIEYLRQAR